LFEQLIDIRHLDLLAECGEDDTDVILRDQTIFILVKDSERLEQVLLGTSVGAWSLG
jgi:hypothetical protein